MEPMTTSPISKYVSDKIDNLQISEKINFCLVQDVEEAIEFFKPMIIGVDKMVGWNHADFLMAKDLGMITKKIIKLMNRYSVPICP